MISQELVDEIIFLSLKGKYISKELIEKIVLDQIENCDSVTQNLFGGLYFDTVSLDFCVAEVDENNRIVANYDEMLRLSDLERYKSYLERNFKILCCLLHEIEHLKEDSKMMKSNFESKIIKFSQGEYIFYQLFKRVLKNITNREKAEDKALGIYEKYYEKNWGLIPNERIAEVNARSNLLNSLINYPGYEDKFFTEYKNLTTYYINALKMEYEIGDYKENKSPLFRYFKSLKCQKVFNYMLNKSSQFNIHEKMMYGFPITPKDVIKLNKMKIKSRR